MKKLMFAVLFVSVAGPLFAHADAFEDRRALAAKREVQKKVQEYWTQNYQRNVVSIKAVRQFAAGHSGLAQDPDCAVIPAKCEGQFCHGYGGSSSRDPYPRIAFSNASPRGAYYFESCKIALRNGLVCEASLINWGSDEPTALDATCYDAAGLEKDYKILDADIKK